jgi:hypothetical protein
MNSTFAAPAHGNISWKWRLLPGAAAVLILAALQHVPVRADGSIGGVGDICPFRNLTGLPCPLCGMTRSLLCFFQGDWHDSLLWHPLGPLLGISAVIGFCAWMISGLRMEHLAAKLPWRLCGVLMVLLFAGCWALRLAGVFPLPLSP